MAASAGTVTLDLDANSVKLIRELNKAQQQTKKSAYRMRKDMERSFKAMGKSAVALGVALTATAKISISFADKIGKTAKATGLAAEKFQELEFAAKRSGIEASLFSSSMVAFVKRVGEAGAGMGPLVSGLKNLNPELLQAIINAKDQAEALGILADGVMNAGSATEQAAITNAAFGRSGVVMVNMLRDGSKGLADYAKKARDLGVIMDERLIQNAEDAADKMGDLQKVLQIRIASAVTENADAIIELTEALIRFVGMIGKAVSGWNHWLAVQGVGVNSLDEIRARGAELVEERRRIEEQLANTNPYNQQSVALLESQLERIKAEQKTLQDMAKKLQAEPFKPFSIDQKLDPSGVPALASLPRDPKYMPSARAESDRLIQESIEITEQHMEYRNELEREYQDLLNLSKTPLDLHNEQLDRIHMLYEQGIIPSVEEYAEALLAANERFAETQDGTKTVFDEMDQFATQAARNIQSHFADFLFDPMEEGFKGMVKGFADSLKRMAAEALASQILNMIGGSFGDGGWGAVASSFFGGGRAMGGPVAAGVPYLVGERGPEIVVPNTSGTVVPNHQLGGVTVNIDARETDNPARILALTPLIESQIESNIKRKMTRGYW